MKKILVTGGAGFIGSHTVVELCGAGVLPVVADNFSNSDPFVLEGLGRLLGKDIPVYRIDVGDEVALDAVFREVNPSGVIHFAAFKSVNESVEKPLEYYRNNVSALVALLSVMRRRGVRDLVFSSSCTVYGQPDQNPVTEDTPPKPANSPYGTTKQMGEQIIRDLCAADPSFRAVLLRYFNPVGAHPSGWIGELPFGIPNNLVPYITQTAAGIRSGLTVFGTDYSTPDGSCIRDFIHVCDVASAHVSALQWLEDKPGICRAFNLGVGKGHSVLEVIRSFVSVTGEKLAYHVGPRREGDVEQIWADTSRVESELRWKPRYGLDDAMRDAWKWQLHLRNFSGKSDHK